MHERIVRKRTIGSCLLIVVAITCLAPDGINSSTINRSFAENLQNGINIAGKMFGFDAASDVAELVARAFANNAPISKRQSSVLEGENGGTGYNSEGSENDASTSSSINDTDDTASKGENGFMGNILRIIGLDTGKLGALAINGIIFIAQMIGRSLISTFGIKSPNLSYARLADDPSPSLDSPLNWILENQSSNEGLAQQMLDIRDKTLPQQIVQAIAKGFSGSENGDNAEQTDCIKLLLCKSAPIVWGMQRAIFDRIDGNQSDASDDKSADDAPNDKRNGNRLEEYFKYLPEVSEFKNHGDACEVRYNRCNIFSSTSDANSQ